MQYGGGGGPKTCHYLVQPPFSSRSATHLLHIELVRLLIVVCVMLVHSSSMAVWSCWTWKLQECVLYHAVTALSWIVGLRVEDLWCWHLYILYVSQGQKMNGYFGQKCHQNEQTRPQILDNGAKKCPSMIEIILLWLLQLTWDVKINEKCWLWYYIKICSHWIKFLHCDWFPITHMSVELMNATANQMCLD